MSRPPRWARSRAIPATSCAGRGASDPGVEAGDFLPRSRYGDYLAEVLADAERRALAGAELERCHDEALAVRVGDGPRPLAVELASGGRLEADRLVLALGNPPPNVPGGADGGAARFGRFHPDPWDTGIAAAAAGDRSVLLIGTGLTMVDVALVLAESGPSTEIHAISRNGLLPRSHLAGGARPEKSFDLPSGPLHPRRADRGGRVGDRRGRGGRGRLALRDRLAATGDEPDLAAVGRSGPPALRAGGGPPLGGPPPPDGTRGRGDARAT